MLGAFLCTPSKSIEPLTNVAALSREANTDSCKCSAHTHTHSGQSRSYCVDCRYIFLFWQRSKFNTIPNNAQTLICCCLFIPFIRWNAFLGNQNWESYSRKPCLHYRLHNTSVECFSQWMSENMFLSYCRIVPTTWRPRMCVCVHLGRCDESVPLLSVQLLHPLPGDLFTVRFSP